MEERLQSDGRLGLRTQNKCPVRERDFWRGLSGRSSSDSGSAAADLRALRGHDPAQGVRTGLGPGIAGSGCSARFLAICSAIA